MVLISVELVDRILKTTVINGIIAATATAVVIISLWSSDYSHNRYLRWGWTVWAGNKERDSHRVEIH